MVHDMNILVPFTPPVSPTWPDSKCLQVWENYQPSYYTVVGLVTARLHKPQRLHNGSLGALYDLRVVNPQTGRTESTRYLYGLDRLGNPKELKKLSTLVK